MPGQQMGTVHPGHGGLEAAYRTVDGGDHRLREGLEGGHNASHELHGPHAYPNTTEVVGSGWDAQ